jgi:hypothetical protein
MGLIEWLGSEKAGNTGDLLGGIGNLTMAGLQGYAGLDMARQFKENSIMNRTRMQQSIDKTNNDMNFNEALSNDYYDDNPNAYGASYRKKPGLYGSL